MSNEETHYTNSSLTGNINVKSAGDTTLKGANITGKVNTEIGGDLNIESVQDTKKMSHEQASWGVSGGVSISNVTGIAPNGGAHAAGGADHDNYALTEKQSGITTTGDSTIKVAGDVDLTGAHIKSTDGKGTLEVGGEINAKTLEDTRDKDGGYGGGGGGIDIDGIPSGSVQFGRVDQIKQDIDQKATIDMNIKGPVSDGGIESSGGPKINGDLNRDGDNMTQVNKDEHIAGNDVEIHLGYVAPKKPKTKPKDDDGGPVIKLPYDEHDGPSKPTPPTKPEPPTPPPPTPPPPPPPTAKPKVRDVDPRYVLSVTNKSVRDKVSQVNNMTDAQLAKNPVKITIPQSDGPAKEYTIRSAKDLEQLNGQTVKFGGTEHFGKGVLPKGFGGSDTVTYKIEKGPSGNYEVKTKYERPSSK
jgi:hypothetical protein